MRESLTILAVLLIVVLTTALVGPYFVDWNAHRGQIEARLSGLLGADVTVTGPIDVKLLPRPIFRLQDVSVAGHGPQAPSATAARVDMELSLTALLRGDIQFVDADVTAPVVTVPLGADQSIVLPDLSPSTIDRVSLAHIGLREGTLLFAGADGRAALTLTGIGGDAEAESLTGPFKFAGALDTARGPLGLHLATGALDRTTLRVKLGFDAGAGMPKTDLDGLVALAPAGRATTLAFDGALAAAGTRALAGTGTVLPWRFTAHLHAVPGRIEASDGELRAGADGRALVAAVSGAADLAAAPAATLTLHARQADLGRLAVPADQAPDAAAPDPGATRPIGDALAALGALAGDADLATGLPVPVTLDYGIDTLAAGRLTLAGLSGHVVLAPGRPLAGTLAVATPDDSAMTFDGAFEPGPAAVFKGRVTAATAHLRRFTDSLAADLPGVAAAVRQALPVDSLRAAGTVDISAVGFAAHDVTLALDDSRFAGTVTLTRAVGADPARLFADLTSDALDLEALPDWRDTARAAAGLDVSLTLVARAVRLASSDTGSLSAGRIALDVKKVGPLVTLDRLSLAGVGGATAEFSGRSDGASAHVEGHLDARRLHDIMALVDRVAPGSVTDRIADRADALSPAILAVVAEAAIAADGTLTPTLLTLDGTAAATKVALHLAPGEAGRPDPAAGNPPFTLALTLDAPDSGALLRQAGLAIAPASAAGRGHLEAGARRDAAGVLAATLSATFGDTMLSADGRSAAGGRLTGHVTLKSANVAPLARALQLASPEAGAAWPGEAAGTLLADAGTWTAEALGGEFVGTPFKGRLTYAAQPSGATQPALTGSMTVDRLPLALLAAPVLGPLPAPRPGAVWPDTPFAPALLSLPRSEIALAIPSLPLTGGATARDAHTTLRLAPGAVTLADLSARLGDGRIGGTVTLRRDQTGASLAGHVEWTGLPVASPSFGGTSQGTLDLAGSGASVGAVMASLGGSGTLKLDDARLPRFDPGAVARVIAGTDASAATLDSTTIAADLGQELDHGALSLGAVATPLTVAAGVVRADAVKVEGPIVSSETSGALDLRSLLLSLKTTARLRSVPKDWVGGPPQVGVTWKGPFGAPAREIDAATLVNGIAARAIARDQTRIEDFQDDIRERAFFARKLRAIEAEQQAVREKAQAEQAAADKAKLQQLLQSLPQSNGTSMPLDLRPPPMPMPPRRPVLRP